MGLIKYFNTPGGKTGDLITESLVWSFGETALADDTNMALDASSTITGFSYEVPAGKEAVITAVTFEISTTVDDVNFMYRSREFANTGDALTNGVLVDIMSDTTTSVLDLLGDVPIRQHADFIIHEKRVSYPVLEAANDTFEYDGLYTSWDFSDVRGLSLSAGQFFTVRVNDDLTNITLFRCTIHGVLFTLL